MVILLLLDCGIGLTTLVGMLEYSGIGYGAVGNVMLAVWVGVIVIEEALIVGIDGVVEALLLVARDIVIWEGFLLSIRRDFCG